MFQNVSAGGNNWNGPILPQFFPNYSLLGEGNNRGIFQLFPLEKMQQNQCPEACAGEREYIPTVYIPFPGSQQPSPPVGVLARVKP